MSYTGALLFLHVAGAIIGFGPAFAFAPMGPLAKSLGGPQALGILKAIYKVQGMLVLPIALVIQPLTGALLIFSRGLDEGFFSREWLWIAILLYAILVSIATLAIRPAIAQMIKLAEDGKGQTPEFSAMAKRTAALGPLSALLIVIIIFLMEIRPGA